MMIPNYKTLFLFSNYLGVSCAYAKELCHDAFEMMPLLLKSKFAIFLTQIENMRQLKRCVFRAPIDITCCFFALLVLSITKKTEAIC